MRTKLIKRIVNNDYLFSIIAKVGGLFLGVFLSALSARFFGAELKGIIAVIDNEASLYAVFLGLGVYQAYPFFRKKNPGICAGYVNTISTMFLGLEIVTAAIAVCFFENNITQMFVLLIAPVLVYVKQLNYIILIEYPRRRNVSSLFLNIVEILVMIVFVLLFEANFALAIVYCCCVQICNLVISFVNLRMNPFRLRLSTKGLVSYIKFGFIPMLVYLCMTINYKIDIQMLKWMRVVSYERIGIYSIGVSLATKVWLIPDAIKDILLSRLVKGSKDEEVARVIRINLMVCVFAIAFLALFGKMLIQILYGAEFGDTYYVMLFLFIGIVGMIFYKMIYSFNISKGKRVVNLVFLGGSAIINVVGNYFAIPHFGIWGACVSSVLSYSLCGLCFLVYFHKVTGIRYRKILIMQREDYAFILKYLGKRNRAHSTDSL